MSRIAGPEHCRARADEMIQRAARAPTEEARMSFLELAGYWLQLADNEDESARPPRSWRRPSHK